jgi:hypothetical protein
VDRKEKWYDTFKKKEGRNPTAGEFAEAKLNNFIDETLGLDDTSYLDSKEPVEDNPVEENQELAETKEPVEDSADNNSAEENQESAETKEPVDDSADDSLVEESQESAEDKAQDSTKPDQNEVDEDDSNDLEDTGANLVDEVDEDSTEEHKLLIEEWMQAFQLEHARKPNLEDFAIGKLTNFDLTQIPNIDKLVEDYQEGVMPRKSWKNWSKRRKAILLASLAAILALALLIAYGSYYYSQDQTSERFTEDYNDVGNIDKSNMENYIWEDSHEALSKSDLKLKPNLPKKLKKDAQLPGSSLVRQGSHFLIFPKYKIALKPQEMQITTNAKGVEILVNGKSQGDTKTETYSKVLSHMMPGEYVVKAKGNVGDQKVDIKSVHEVISGKESFNLNLTYASFSVRSNILDGDLYIGDDMVGSLENGKYTVDRRVISKGSSVYVAKDATNVSIKSKEIPIDEITNGITIDLNAPQVLSKDVATDLLSQAYADLTSYGNDHKIPDNLDSCFVDGANNPMFIEVKDMIDSNTTNSKNRPADYVDFSDLKVTSVTPTGEDTSAVDFEVSVKFGYSTDTDKENDTSGTITDRISWSANVKYLGLGDENTPSSEQDFKILSSNGESKHISREDTVK